MSDRPWLLYGANGYTGELIAAEAKRRGLRPVLAGRREGAVRAVAERLGLEARGFALDAPAQIARELDGFAAVLLAAGPFSATSGPVVEACLRAGAHYLDITGEIAVFEACHARDAEARERGVAIIPGVGFDVVPSDCLAASLKAALPAADRLELAFAGGGSWSRGTAKTMAEGIPQQGAIREHGMICRVPLAWKTAEIPFRDQRRMAVTIPWGDVSTAFYSTRIPNISVYMALPPRLIRALRLARPIAPLLGAAPAQRLIKAVLDRRSRGPEERVRETARMQLWGRVTDRAGRAVEGTLETPEGYRLTAAAAVESVARLLAGGVRSGALTPSLAFGARFVTELEGCDLRVPA